MVKILLIGVFLSIVGVLSTVSQDPNIDSNKVRYGNLSAFDKSKGHTLAVVNSKEVYAEMSEYKRIKKEGIKPGTARYTQLMQICTKRYRSACKKLCGSKNYSLIVEIGGVRKYTPPDETSTLISLIGS